MIKHWVEKHFFIEKILYLTKATKFLHACKGIPHAINSCSDYPVISIIDFPCHLLFPAFMLHGKALKAIPIHDFCYRSFRWNYRTGVDSTDLIHFFTNNKR
jgi:hypothetical protein